MASSEESDADRYLNAITALQDSLDAEVCTLGRDEMRVLVAIARRLKAGRIAYGDLRIRPDKRDWDAELRDELLDGLVYGTVAILKDQDRLALRRAASPGCSQLMAGTADESHEDSDR